MTRIVLFASICAVGLLAAASPGRGQTTEADEAELVAEAQRLVDEASRHYSAGRFERALEALRKAEPLAEEAEDPALPSIRFNIARCLEKLDRPELALEAYQRYDQLPDAPHRKRKAFEAMRKLEGRVYGVLSVSCAPSGAVVRVDGLTGGSRPCPWQSARVEPGAYEVEVRAPGHETEIRSVRIRAGAAENVQVSLRPTPSASPNPQLVEASRAPSKSPSPWPFIGLGSGAAVAGVGGIFTALAMDARNDAERQPPGSRQDDAVSSFDTHRTVSYILYGVGGALAAAGLVLFFVPHGQDDPEAARVEAHPAGLSVHF